MDPWICPIRAIMTKKIMPKKFILALSGVNCKDKKILLWSKRNIYDWICSDLANRYPWCLLYEFRHCSGLILDVCNHRFIYSDSSQKTDKCFYRDLSCLLVVLWLFYWCALIYHSVWHCILPWNLNAILPVWSPSLDELWGRESSCFGVKNVSQDLKTGKTWITLVAL